MRNDGLLRYVVAVRDVGVGDRSIATTTGFGLSEQVIAHRTAVEFGFMTDDGDITKAGHKWVNSQFSPRNPPTPRVNVGDSQVPSFIEVYATRRAHGRQSYDLLKALMPPKVFAAMCEVVGEGSAYGEFEATHGTPHRSTRLLVSEGHDMCARILRMA